MTLLAILSPQEKSQFELPPKFNNEERTLYFSLTPGLKRSISRMENHHMRAGFLLQLAYFRANARFYPTEKFKKRDIQHVQAILQCKDIDLQKYNSTINSKHRSKILVQQGWSKFGSSENDMLTNFALRQANNQVKPKDIFIGLIDQCWKHQFCIPSYTDLCLIIQDCINVTELQLIDCLSRQLNSEDCQSLENILSYEKNDFQRSRPFITDLKNINQGLKPGEIKENIKNTLIFKDLIMSMENILKTLPLSDPATEYFATWFSKVDYQQLNQLSDRYKVYLHLLAFIKHQFYLRQDALVEILQKSVNSMLHAVNSKLSNKEQETKKERNEALQILNNSHKSLLEFSKAVITIVESKDATPNEKYHKIEELVNLLDDLTTEDEGKLNTIDEYLSKEARNQAYYELLKSQSNKLQRRVSGIINVLEFDRTNSSPELLEAIDYFKETDGKITHRAPTAFLSDSELASLYHENKFVVPLYKCLLFVHISKGIRSDKLNLLYSYRYRAFQDYMIDKQYWKDNKERILEECDLSKFADGKDYLGKLKEVLDEKYHSVNQRIIDNKNPFFKINAAGKPVITTPGVDNEGKEFITTTLTQNGYTPILKVLKEVNAATDFTQCFKHFSTKNVKLKPSEETLLAGVIGKGCNIGIRKLANISTGISEHILHNAVNWCLDLKNITEANQRIVSAIHGLGLANNYINKPSILHSSSDGRKVNVSVDSLHANYSFKYFGKEKGVTMYTFIDERQSLFYSTVFSSSDREAAYVIDGLMHNNVSQNQIHSTDTHGYTEQVFAATHMIGVDFAPRIKNIGHQRLISFSARRTYEKKGYVLLPSRSIDKKHILQHWDDVLRFIATIKMNHTSASQLFSRLNSYNKSHPLYKALQELGRIIKSNFILTYYDDVELRQQIQKQLNRIEQTNKFAHAVFFDNDQAFQVGTKEEQQLSTACQVLLQNSIILWNYLYLSNLIIETPNKEQRSIIIKSIGEGSVITWAHVNLRGEYDFTRRAENDPQFDYKKIKSLNIAKKGN